MDDLLADFLAETREMLEAIGGEIVAWEADPSDSARLDAIFRFVHTVKGNCGFFDFPRLARLSHAAEDALADCRAGRREPDGAFVSAVLAIIDRIGEITDAIEAGEELVETGDELLLQALTGDDIEMGGSLPASSLEGTKEQGDEDASRVAKPVSQRSIRLPVDLLDEVMKGVSDLVLARNDLARRMREAGADAEIDGPFDRLSAILGTVREGVTRMRMQRLEHLFASLPRLARDLSGELGKQVMVDFEGGDVELDREMIELMRDPLTHIIRNAIDHGIEPPAERIAAGKREIGLMRFAARQSGNEIVVVISDDGQGIDTARLAEKAKSAGIFSSAELEAMSDERKLDLIFEPGLSTAEEVSEVSGRGVGMDVVRSNIEKIGGSISVSSNIGKGTVFELHLPLTLSIMPALTVVCDGQPYALPQSYVEEIVFASSNGIELARAGDRLLVTFRGDRVPCVSLREVLGMDAPSDSDWQAMTLVMIRLATGEAFALGVERVHNHEEVVVKPIAPAIMATGLYAGATLLDDGSPMMLLDIRNIAAMQGFVGEGRRQLRSDTDGNSSEDGKSTVPVMLFSDFEGRRRAIRLDKVLRIDTVPSDALDVEDERAQVIIDGRIFALAGLDGGPVPDGRCRLLRLGDGERELALFAADVHDTVEVSEDLAPAPNEGVEGMALVDGKAIAVINAAHLLVKIGLPIRKSGADIAEQDLRRAG